MGRRPCCSKQEELNRGAWSAQEDMILSNYIHAHGETGWRSLSRKAGLNRCGKSCRLRWLNYLRPDIKRGNISSDEEELIIRMHRLLGNRWALIAGRLPGRTDNEIKNYWNTHLSKKLAMSSSTALNSTTHMPLLRRSSSVSGMKKQSPPNSLNPSDDDGTTPRRIKGASDKEGTSVFSTPSDQLLQHSFMADLAVDSLIQEPCDLQLQPENCSQDSQEGISSAGVSISYPVEYCHPFSLPFIELGTVEDFSAQMSLLQPTAFDLEDMCPVENRDQRCCNADYVNCLAMAAEQAMAEIHNSTLRQPEWMMQQQRHQNCDKKSSHVDLLDEFGQLFDNEVKWEEDYRNINLGDIPY